MLTLRIRFVAPLLVLLVWGSVPTIAQAQATAEQILKYRPAQANVDIEMPSEAEVAQCTAKVEKGKGGNGYVVYGPSGQPLRRFVDTDGDDKVDQWRYYQQGLEVYRDMDTDQNYKVDQSRWLNTGGSRWGVDANEDGKIERWIRISAEEVSREAVRAMSQGDDAALGALLLDAQDAKALGLSRQVAGQILETLSGHKAKMQKVLSGSKVLTSESRWVRFDSSLLMPNSIPKEDGNADRDLVVYENVMAIVMNGTETGFVQIGELIQVGDVWKMTGIPQPVEAGQVELASSGFLMNPAAAAGGGPNGNMEVTEQLQELLKQLETLDKSAPDQTAGRDAMVAYSKKRSLLLGQLASASGSDEDRDMWQRQRVDGIAASIQMDVHPDGIKELAALEEAYRKDASNSEMVPYILFHRKAAEYNLDLQKAEMEDRAKIQDDWISHLQSFVKDYPQSENAADALLQLGVSLEFMGKADAAKQAYETLVTRFKDSPAMPRGEGALRRLTLVGQPLPLAGAVLGGGKVDVRQYQGKVLLVAYWATWCQPCTQELPQLIELFKTHRGDGFEVLGVNVDSPGAPIDQFLKQHQVPWPHIHEEGGLESKPARDFGIITLPTMFLVGKDGRVLSSNVSLEDLKKQLPELLKK